MSHPQTGRAFILLSVAVWLLFGAASGLAGAASWSGERLTIDGVVNIMNPDKPINSEQTIKAKEKWKIGEEDDEYGDEGELIGYISDVLIDEEENYYLLDRSLSTIKVYNPEGEFVKNIGREGDGPGEFRQPGGFFFLPNGNIAVAQMMPGRLITIDRDGIPTGNITFEGVGGMGMHILQKALGGPGFGLVSLIVPVLTGQNVSMTQKLFSIDPSGEELNSYIEIKEENVTRLRMATHPIEFDMYYSL